MSEKFMRLANGINGLTLVVGRITIDGYGQKIISDDSGVVDAHDSIPYDAEKEIIINMFLKVYREHLADVKQSTRQTIETILKR